VTSYHLLALGTCVGHLAFALLAASRAARLPIARVLCLLTLDIFALNLADVAADLSSPEIWNRVDHFAAALTTPLAAHFIILFVGRGRALRGLVAAVYALFGGVALLVLLRPGFGGSAAWSGAILGGIALVCPLIVALLIVHLRHHRGGFERARTQLVLLALTSGVVFGTTDLWGALGIEVPRLTAIGLLITVGALAVAVLRLDLFEQRVGRLGLVGALGVGVIAVGAYLIVIRAAREDGAALLAGLIAVSASASLALRQVLGVAADHRAQAQQLATLGRMSAQMAHDLKNPIAALKGSIQFLREERAQGRSIDGYDDHLELIEGQIDRLDHVVSGYRRLSSVEPSLAPVALNPIVEALVQAQPGDRVRAELAPSLPSCAADRDLVEGAIENLIRNAVEALDAGGRVIVRTEPSRRGTRPGVRVVVQDDGAGMNPRVQVRALDDFFTTKSSGSGLGLAFVRRVADSHRGELSLESEEGRGTTAALWLPLGAGEGRPG
jgi:two-component system sensor histidine kinase HydH